MLQFDLVIIGGGACGLSAGVTALKNGVKKVLILERNQDLGGNLNLFIHKGFKNNFLGEEVTGPELASSLINIYEDLGGIFKTDTQVLEVTKNKIITYINPDEGIEEIKASAIIIASGCREKYTGNIEIPIHKYTGVFTLSSAHRLINKQGFLPGKNTLIVGKNKWSLLLARRLVIEGGSVKAIIDDTPNGVLTDEELDIIDGFNIKVISNHKVIDLDGEQQVTEIYIEDLETKEISRVLCDSLILTVGYYPEIDFIRKANAEIENKKILKVDNYETSIKGIFACGTVLKMQEKLFESSEDGEKVGEIVADYIKRYIY